MESENSLISATKSGLLSNFSINIKMNLNAEDVNKQGAIFLVAQKIVPGTHAVIKKIGIVHFPLLQID